MVPLWFTLSALCFVGAAALLYVDIDRRRGLGRRRKSWARSHGFDYETESTEILSRWKRGVMSTVGDVTARNVVLGQIRGAFIIGAGQHHKQWSGIDAPVIEPERNFVQRRHLPLACFVQDLPWLGILSRVHLLGLSRRQIRQHSAR